jgi:amidase
MFNIIETSIKDIKQAFNEGTLDSLTLTKMYLERIAYIDQGPIKYNSVLEVNPNAIYEAMVKDEERNNNEAKGFLHGIPILLKDNINTTGLMHTTAGSLALKDNYAPYDAFIVKRLKEEGAIILGKANLTEFANFMTINMRNGYSSLGKEVLCPYNLDIDPSGSSAGSAVSVSINLAPISIGTETGGSIMSPSMQNGIVGLKPTMGLVSRTGIVPISSTLDTAGPMARNVYDAALLLSAIRGNDPLDPITQLKTDEPIDYTKALEHINYKNLRIGIDLNNYNNLSQKRKDAFDQVVETLKQNGVTIIKDLNIIQTKKIYHVMLFEFKTVFNQYLSTLGVNTKYKTLKEIIDFNSANQKEALKYGQVIFEEAQYKTSGRMNEREYIEAINEKIEATKELEIIFKEHNLDAIYFASYTSLGPHCGFPTMTVPIGIDEKILPIGSYLLGNKFKEDRLLKVGKTIEDLIQGRINPIND